MSKRWMFRVAVAAALIGSATSLPVSAQSPVDFTAHSNLLVGYVTSPPRQLLGLGAAAIAVRGWGVFADAKLTTDSPAGEDSFLSGRTPAQAAADGDLLFDERSAWTTVHLAAVKGLTRAFAVYLGGGAAWETRYHRYEDPTGERGNFGFYWVQAEARSRVHPSFQAGAFLHMAYKLVLQFGGQTAPSGFTVGAHLRLL